MFPYRSNIDERYTLKNKTFYFDGFAVDAPAGFRKTKTGVGLYIARNSHKEILVCEALEVNEEGVSGLKSNIDDPPVKDGVMEDPHLPEVAQGLETIKYGKINHPWGGKERISKETVFSSKNKKDVKSTIYMYRAYFFAPNKMIVCLEFMSAGESMADQLWESFVGSLRIEK